MKSIGQHSQHHLNRTECSVAQAQTHTAAIVIIQVSIETTSASCTGPQPKKPSGSHLSQFRIGTKCTVLRETLTFAGPVKEIECAAYTKKSNNNGNSLILSIQHSVQKDAKYKERMIGLCGESDFCHNKTLESFNRCKRPAPTNTASAPNTNHGVHHSCKCCRCHSKFPCRCLQQQPFCNAVARTKEPKKAIQKPGDNCAWQAEN